MQNEELEQAMQDKGLNAPRVTQGMIDDVVSAATVTFTILPNTTTTVCSMILASGYAVIGTSACVSKENFDTQLGARIALDDAKSKLWPLMGYALADDIYNDKLRNEALMSQQAEFGPDSP